MGCIISQPEKGLEQGIKGGTKQRQSNDVSTKPSLAVGPKAADEIVGKAAESMKDNQFSTPLKETDSAHDYEQNMASNLRDTGSPGAGPDQLSAINADIKAEGSPTPSKAASTSPASQQTPFRQEAQGSEGDASPAVDTGDVQLTDALAQVATTGQQEEGGDLQQQSPKPGPQQQHSLQPLHLHQQQHSQASGDIGSSGSQASAKHTPTGPSPAPSGISAASNTLPYPASSINNMLPLRGTASAILTGALPSQSAAPGTGAWLPGLTGASPSPSSRPPGSTYSVPPPLYPPSTSPHAALMSGLAPRFPATPAGYGALPPWPGSSTPPTNSLTRNTQQPPFPQNVPQSPTTPLAYGSSPLPPLPHPAPFTNLVPGMLSPSALTGQATSAQGLSSPFCASTYAALAATSSYPPSIPAGQAPPSSSPATSPNNTAVPNGDAASPVPAAPPSNTMAATPLCVALQRPPLPPQTPSPPPSASAHVKPSMPDTGSKPAAPPPPTPSPAPLGYAAKATGSYAAQAAAQRSQQAAAAQRDPSHQTRAAQQQQQQNEPHLEPTRSKRMSHGGTKQSKEMQALWASMSSNSGVASALQGRVPLSQRHQTLNASPSTPSTPTGAQSIHPMMHSQHMHHHHHHRHIRHQRDAPGSRSDNRHNEQLTSSRPMMPTAAAVRASQLQYEREQLRQLQREQRELRLEAQNHPFMALPGGMSMRPGMSSASSRMAMTGLLSRRTSGFSTNASQNSFQSVSDRFSTVSEMEYRPKWR